ncbi:MAG: triacylglycerol lipase [Mycobacterium sp.]|nr:triacylglycerol lipase [Mycobacterium sp.]
MFASFSARQILSGASVVLGIGVTVAIGGGCPVALADIPGTSTTSPAGAASSGPKPAGPVSASREGSATDERRHETVASSSSGSPTNPPPHAGTDSVAQLPSHPVGGSRDVEHATHVGAAGTRGANGKSASGPEATPPVSGEQEPEQPVVTSTPTVTATPAPSAASSGLSRRKEHIADAVTSPTKITAPTQTGLATGSTSDDDATRIAPGTLAQSQGPAATVTSTAITTPVSGDVQSVSGDGAAAVGSVPKREPAEVVPDGIAAVTATVSRVFTNLVEVLTPFSSTPAPDAPVATPAMWAMLAFARREFESGIASTPTDVEPVATQFTSAPVDTIGPAVAPTARLAALDAAPSALSAADQSLYTGRPTLLTQVVELGLRVVDVILKPFGGLLAFTSLDIPFLTDGVPPFFLTGGLDVQKSDFQGTTVWTLEPQQPSGKYVVALHGGAYTAQVSIFHWETYADLARDTGATVVVPLYPLISQGGTAGVAVPDTADFISQTIQRYGADNVSVLGDSAGGGLAVAAVQELVRRGSPVPGHLVLLAPWLDTTVSDPRSKAIDPDDPLLDVPSLQKDGQLWAGDLDSADPVVSPIYGSFAGLPPTTVISGSHDLLTPDSLRLQQLAITQGLTNFTFDFRDGLIHDFPIFFFLPEATAIRPEIYHGLALD